MEDRPQLLRTTGQPPLWSAIGYLVTQREYHRLLELERSQLSELDEFADYVYSHLSGGDAETVCAPIAEWLLAEPDPDEVRAEAMERVRDIIEGAVSRGELPTSIRNEGSAQLPWGVLDDWLYVEPFQVSLRHPPVEYVPLLAGIGGDAADWEIGPDASTASILRHRLELIRYAARFVWWLPGNHGLSPHPPATRDQVLQQRERFRTLTPTLSRTETECEWRMPRSNST